MIGAGFRFTSRQFFAAIALLCVTLVLLTIEPRLSVYLSALIVGLGLLGLGVYHRKWLPFLAGLWLVLVSIVLPTLFSSVTTWVGTSKLPVFVLVLDTDTFEPVEGATIEVFQGPWSPLLERHISGKMKARFIPDMMVPGVGKLTTNKQGWCKFDHQFWAAGTDSTKPLNFYNRTSTGYISTGHCWLKASAPGRGSVMIPIDGQSEHSRDINDRSPLMITVPLRLQAAAE